VSSPTSPRQHECVLTAPNGKGHAFAQQTGLSTPL
jgi:hypothetical protein